MHDEGVVLGELEPEREGGKPLPILVFELIGDPLMGGLELGKLVAGALRVPPLQAMLIVVATHRKPAELPHEPNNPKRIRALGHQISDQNKLIVLFPARLLQQVLELLTASRERLPQ